MIVTIIPIEDHRKYKVNNHILYKDSSDNWVTHNDLSRIERKAFSLYISLIINNKRVKKHLRSTYKD